MAHKLQALTTVGATTIWNGSPQTILPTIDTLLMPQTPNGSMVFAAMPKSANTGSISLTSGATSQLVPVPGNVQVPNIVVNNWGGNNLQVVNISSPDATPIWVEAFGPNIPGQPTPIPITNGTPFKLNPQPSTGSVASGVTAPRNMLLRMQANTGDLAVIALIGGELGSTGNNAYVFGLNVSNPGQATGYTKAVSSNSIDFQFNWSTAVVYLANMSPSTSAAVTLNLIGL